jgi:4a-hydroxytetrahydrobiopterin dehydratase
MPALLNADEVAVGLEKLNDWSGNTTSISRTVTLPAFLTAVAVVDRIAVIAEEMDHHPDIDIRWRTLTFICSTHSAGGVTMNDLALAQQIDGVVAAA